jgi:hypothetical protein
MAWKYFAYRLSIARALLCPNIWVHHDRDVSQSGVADQLPVSSQCVCRHLRFRIGCECQQDFATTARLSRNTLLEVRTSERPPVSQAPAKIRAVRFLYSMSTMPFWYHGISCFDRSAECRMASDASKPRPMSLRILEIAVGNRKRT